LHVPHQVWGILQEQSTLFESLHDERNIALLKIPNTTVHELGRTAGRSFAEIVLLQQDDAVPTRHRIQSDAYASRTSTNNGDVPSLSEVGYPIKEGLPVE